MEHANAVGYLDSEGRYSFEFLRPAHQHSKENELDITGNNVELMKDARESSKNYYFRAVAAWSVFLGEQCAWCGRMSRNIAPV